MEQPNSDQLYYIAENFFNKGYYDPTIQKIIESDNQDDRDIPKLLKYIDQCSMIIREASAELTIREMKKRIGQIMGQELSDSYTSTVSREDIFKIYNYIIMTQKSDVQE